MEYFLTITNLENDGDLLTKFKKLFLEYEYYSLFLQMIDKTRNHETCLLICDNFENILHTNRDEFSSKEFDSIDQKIIKLRLHCLDKTDRWNKYVEYFDYIFKTKTYFSEYSIDSDIERFGRFYIKTIRKYHHVHFLYNDSYRYDVIQRKIAKSLKSDKLGNLRHHPQSDLSDEEIERRYNEVIKWANMLNK
ncbi:hypothetical protein M5J14_18480 [Lysinibacillus sp. OL1_EC]|uniref:hypothetical protein n=1 Tax=unclassified Lysinibacillus TaxID=2636778 RepID=UPI00103A8D07|nr:MULTISPECIES: hypothetical protein [unclassified Lysinibacillus]MCM0626485.1 hypothetical protein [Lysinibacillus sp. OL1_EC]TBV85650.1 hypothetical protein EW028_19695 [Lysinibacillus sp. OL1]